MIKWTRLKNWKTKKSLDNDLIFYLDFYTYIPSNKLLKRQQIENYLNMLEFLEEVDFD